jgi:protein-S-isoprenylcysteine O-methyltransferase Ste14
LGWECIAWILASNYRFWFDDPLAVHQLFSWVLLAISGYLVIAGVIRMKKHGKPDNGRNEKNLYQFEKTTELVDLGIFRYIRHPLYSSLIFLAWGICLKHPGTQAVIVAALSSLFLYQTALVEEKECTAYFGEKYLEYMNRSKRFIPFIF